ncbi:2-hydroxypropyl-CoM lyase [Planctomycetes bacterium CA13]|uniref:2-hydroxypropyl-CoM lyase n=1 Tax=Novipirellula herctigrandis TaxID=2527986 RepID=A0A5C5YWC0_9BACT|nr:2-hydroxypropyl-CoM lyase [Planctomycetes bacterium CA13]
MKSNPLRTTVIGSYPFPGWLEFASQNLDQFGPVDILEMQEDASVAAVRDQVAAGLDVITDGEQTRLDFNLSFYGYLHGIDLESSPPRRWGPPAHDQRGKHDIIDTLSAPNGLGAVEEFQRLQQIAADIVPDSVTLKASIPGPFTLSGRLNPNKQYPDRYAITEALLPMVRDEVTRLVEVGCKEICVDEPSMSCYAHKEDTRRFVDIFNRTIEPIVGKTRVCMHMCFGNFKGRSVGGKRPECMFPDFLDMKVNEMHLEMATLNFAPLELIKQVTDAGIDAAVGIVDVKSYYIETPEDIANRVRACLKYSPADQLVFAPDCGLSQTARWASRQKLANMVHGCRRVREELGL